ncbi:MAG: arginine--tRNA ligase [Ignavibacteriales bacterium]|nr:arginine--tRNA ligase [Ignavibacteriales bacterium]
MKDLLHRQLTAILSELKYPPVEISFDRPKVESHGDLTTNVAMVLAKSVGKNPRQVAQSIVEKLQVDNRTFASVEIAGPGFINFKFSNAYVVESAKIILRSGELFGKSNASSGKKTNVEWVSANPTGPLHSGHGRQVILGKVISNLLEWTGHNVTREYYFNNAGNQMRNLAESIYARYRQELGDDYPFPEEGYKGDYIIDIAKQIVKEKGDSLRETDAERSYFKQVGETWCFNKIKETLSKLDVRHDVFYNEDTLYSTGKIAEVIEEFKKKDLAYDSEGAVWFRATKFGADKDRVIVKSSGEPTYRLPDIAYHREKFRRGFELIVDIFGADHIATIPDVLNGVQALGYETKDVKVIIHQMVSFVNGEEVVKMSKRSANVHTLDELIDEVGVDAVSYFFVMRSVGTHLEFDIALAKEQSEKNPVYYLQYAHARIAGILRFAEQEGFNSAEYAKILEATNFALMKEKEEIDLLKKLLEFPEVVQSCALTFEPHRLTTYLREVAETFHRFYHEHRVINDDKNLMQARLTVCLMAKIVIANGCKILGVSCPEKM